MLDRTQGGCYNLIKGGQLMMNRGLDDKYIEKQLERGASYVNRAFISFAPVDTDEFIVQQTCEHIMQFILAQYGEEYE
jgi:hypothetical protein